MKKVAKKIFDNKLLFWTLVLILLSSAFMRFFRLNRGMVFVGDQEYQATYAMTLVKDFHPIWIGVSAANTGFYLGPGWTYFTALWLYISHGNPLITGWVAAIVGVVTTAAIFLITYDVFKNTTVSVVASVLYAFSPLFVFYDRVYWNPTLMPILALGLFYSLYKTKENDFWWIIFSGLFALVLHTHLSILPLGFIAFYMFVKEFKKIKTRYFLSAFAVFLVLYSPLLVFDYYHNWDNLRTPLRYFEITSQKTSKINPIHHSKALLETFGRLWFLDYGKNASDEVLFDCGQSAVFGRSSEIVKYSERTSPSLLLSLPTLFIIFIFLINKNTWKKEEYKLFTLFFLTIIFSFLLFPGGAFEFYLLGTFPFIVIIFGLCAQTKNKLLRFTIFLFSLIVIVRGTVVVLKAKDDFGIAVKKDIIKKTMEVIGNSNFELTQGGMCHAFEGWRYLFKVYGKTPGRSSSDANFGWLYPEEIKEGPMDYKVLIHEDRVPISSDNKPYELIKSGGFAAYIFKI